MEKLPKTVFEFVSVKDIGNENMARFDAWVKAQPADTLKYFYNWQMNCIQLIPYNYYEMWVKHEQDLALLNKLRDLGLFSQ